MSDKSIDQKNLTLNRILVVIACLTLVGGVIAWVSGYVGLPGKVSTLEQVNITNNAILITLPLRVDNLEKGQIKLWEKYADQVQVNQQMIITLTEIKTSLNDLKDQSAETRRDVKDLHNRAIK